MKDLYNLKEELQRKKTAVWNFSEFKKSMGIIAIVGGILSVGIIVVAAFSIVLPELLVPLFTYTKFAIPALSLLAGASSIGSGAYVEKTRKDIEVLKEDIATTEVEYAQEKLAARELANKKLNENMVKKESKVSSEDVEDNLKEPEYNA